MLKFLLTFLLTSDIEIARNNKTITAFTGNRENQTRKRTNNDNKGEFGTETNFGHSVRVSVRLTG